MAALAQCRDGLVLGQGVLARHDKLERLGRSYCKPPPAERPLGGAFAYMSKVIHTYYENGGPARPPFHVGETSRIKRSDWLITTGKCHANQTESEDRKRCRLGDRVGRD